MNRLAIAFIILCFFSQAVYAGTISSGSGDIASEETYAGTSYQGITIEDYYNDANILLAWSMESLELGSGPLPPGISVGDIIPELTSATLVGTGSPYDGVQHLYVNGTSNYALFNWDNSDINLTGSAPFVSEFFVNVTNFTNGTQMCGWFVDADNKSNTTMTSGDEITVTWEYSGTEVTLETSGADIEIADGYIGVKITIDPTQTNEDITIEIDGAVDGTDPDGVYDYSISGGSIGALVGAVGVENFWIGNASGAYGGKYYIDNFKITTLE